MPGCREAIASPGASAIALLLMGAIVASDPAWATKAESRYPSLEDTVYVDTLPVPRCPKGEYMPNEPYILVHALVGRDGRVKDTRVLDMGKPMVDSAAAITVRQCRFKPGLSNGKRTAVWVVMCVQFTPDLKSIMWLTGSRWGTRPPPSMPIPAAPLGSARAVCDSLSTGFDAGLLDHLPGDDRPKDQSSDDLCVRHSEGPYGEGRYGGDLRKYLVARGWSEIRPPIRSAGGTRLVFRRGELLFMVKGDWDGNPNDDVFQESSTWKIVVGGPSHEEGQLLEILDRWP